MSKLSSNLFLYIAKPVEDEYGRQIGKIASFAVSPNGRVNAVFLEHGDGEFARYTSEQFRIDGDKIILLSTTKLTVKTLCDEIPLIWRKDQALGELSDKKRIPSEMYNEVHKNFEGVLNQLKAEAKSTLENIDTQIARCNQQMRELNSALVHLEIEREIGRIDDSAYESAMEIIQKGFKQINSERNDLEWMRSQLSNMLIGETSTPEKETQKGAAPASTEPPMLPEPPVVVHVKSESKTSA